MIAPQPSPTYTNPLGVDLADPDTIRHDGIYYLYGTSSDSGFHVWISSDLVHWKAHDRLAFSKTAESWGQEKFWAPDVLEHDGTFYLYYNSVGPMRGGRMSHRICVAQSDSPLGQFNDVKVPLLDIGKAMIDAHVFFDSDGKGLSVLRAGPFGKHAAQRSQTQSSLRRAARARLAERRGQANILHQGQSALGRQPCF